MENNIPQITFAIASKNNFRYVKHAVKYIRENCYRKDHIIYIGIDGIDIKLVDWVKEQTELGDTGIMITTGKSGIAAIYNDIAKKSVADFIILYHADMIAGKDMDLHLYRQWNKGQIISATRIEPPLHPSDPAKIVKDFGMWPEEDVADGFKKEEFNKFVESNLSSSEITNGVFAPWLIHKEDYWSVGGHDESFNSHSEDRDLFNRFLLKGFDFIQPWNALVYHLTCRGGQFEHAARTEDLKIKSEDWSVLANSNTKNFIRKWGSPPLYDEYQYPIVVPKFDIGFSIRGSEALVEFLEPWCSTLYTDTDCTNFTKREELNKSFDLQKKIKSLNAEKDNSVLISIDQRTFTDNDFQIIQQLPSIIQDSGEVGEFEINNLTLTIKDLTEYQNNLIYHPYE
jgi:hypothetical protein